MVIAIVSIIPPDFKTLIISLMTFSNHSLSMNVKVINCKCTKSNVLSVNCIPSSTLHCMNSQLKGITSEGYMAAVSAVSTPIKVDFEKSVDISNNQVPAPQLVLKGSNKIRNNNV